MADVGPSERAAPHRGILWGEEILRSGLELRMEAVGGSMLPAIRGGDTLIVRPARASDVAVGDVVVFRRAGTLVAHRLVRKTGANGDTVLVTKGDFLAGPDRPLPADKVLGRVVGVERKGRTRDLTGPYGKTTGWLCVHVLPTVPWFLPLARRLYGRVGRG